MDVPRNLTYPWPQPLPQRIVAKARLFTVRENGFRDGEDVGEDAAPDFLLTVNLYVCVAAETGYEKWR